MDNPFERVCLFLVYEKRIQAALDCIKAAWNRHKLRTERNKSPLALYMESKRIAERDGYWHGDPGDIADVVDAAEYGIDTEAPAPPADELQSDPIGRSTENVKDADELEGQLKYAKEAMSNFDFERADGNWGIDVYCEAVQTMEERIQAILAAEESN